MNFRDQYGQMITQYTQDKDLDKLKVSYRIAVSELRERNGISAFNAQHELPVLRGPVHIENSEARGQKGIDRGDIKAGGMVRTEPKQYPRPVPTKTISAYDLERIKRGIRKADPEETQLSFEELKYASRQG